MNQIVSKLKNRFWVEQWNIGAVRASQGEIYEKEFPIGQVEWLLPEKKNGFYADPFLISHNNKTYLFFEEFDNQNQKGVISYSVLRENSKGELNVSAPKVAISKPFHMSYPFLFEHDGGLYMMPETADANEVALYKPANFPDVWIKAKTILSNFPAVDPTLVFWEGKYWLFCTHQKNGKNSELHIFYSEDVFGPWQPHKENPVKIDLKGARPGGKFFKKDGRLFSWGQNCSQTYGGSLVLKEILELNEDKFAEKELKEIKPCVSCMYDKGLHTLNFHENWVLIDGKRLAGIKKYLNEHVQAIKQKFKKT